MQNTTVQPIILAGGIGERLWPISRELYPKQFLPLLTTKITLFQQTVLRCTQSDVDNLPAIVLCSELHRFIVAEQLREIEQTACQIILEPEKKDTAAAIALAALATRSNNPNATLVVMPSDHYIKGINEYTNTLQLAISAASVSDDIVTLGIKPTNPATEYGYIQAVKTTKNSRLYTVQQFVEKPNKNTAQKYYAQANFFWNSGVFVSHVNTLCSLFDQKAPAILENTQNAWEKRKVDADFIRVDKDAFAKNPSISFDYAIMEKNTQTKMVAMQAQWSDVGDWNALHDVLKESEANVEIGDVISLHADNNYVNAQSRLVTLLGIKDTIVVETPDSVLVANKSQTQHMKSLVQILKQQHRKESKSHTRVHRPWGYYVLIEVGNGYQVKRLYVKPHAKLSVQKHYKRSEHWVVVEGKAQITVGEKAQELSKNTSVYIPQNTLHSLENIHNTPLEIIEIQTGSYLGEDDIVRYEDRYGRKIQKNNLVTDKKINID